MSRCVSRWANVEAVLRALGLASTHPWSETISNPGKASISKFLQSKWDVDNRTLLQEHKEQIQKVNIPAKQ